MADHWKSLANQLGTPGIDVPEAAQTSDGESVESSQREPDALAPETQPSPTAADFEADSLEKKVQPAARSTQPDAGASGGSSTAPPESTFDSPAHRGAEPTAEKPQKGTQGMTAKDKAPDARPAKKKRSSWESLARMFNIPVERAEPDEPAVVEAVEPESVAEPEVQPPNILSMSTGEPSTPENPALDEMFSEASGAAKDSWGAKPRVIDDLGWGDEPADKTDEDDRPSAAAETAPAEDDLDGESDVRRGRSRRRRRRGRGGQAESAAPAEEKSSASTDSAPTSRASEAGEKPAKEFGWGEPESFEAASPETEDANRDEPAAEPERRGNRRRRGRGGRGRNAAASDNAGSDVAEPRQSTSRADQDAEPAPQDDAPDLLPVSWHDEPTKSRRDSTPRRDEKPRSRREEEPRARRDPPPKSDRDDEPRSRRDAEPRSRRNEEPRARRDEEPRGRRTEESRPRRDEEPRSRRGGEARPRRNEESSTRSRDEEPRARRDEEPRSRRDAESRTSRDEEPRSRRDRDDEPRGRHDRDRDEEPRARQDRDSSDETSDDSSEAPRRGEGRRRRRRRPDSAPRAEKGAAVSEDDGTEDETSEHDNVPTWTDSLESIITANTENHKRNEGRGQRGRPRGRR